MGVEEEGKGFPHRVGFLPPTHPPTLLFSLGGEAEEDEEAVKGVVQCLILLLLLLFHGRGGGGVQHLVQSAKEGGGPHVGEGGLKGGGTKDLG